MAEDLFTRFDIENVIRSMSSPPLNFKLALENELKVQFLVHNQPNFERVLIGCWAQQDLSSAKKSTEKSEFHREAGNRLFRANKKLNAIAASRCYTNAILAAPQGSKALALAHANRSASISELGFYKEAYEDCECAIDNGYPKEKMEKLITRQAFCANKLEDYNKLKSCVDKLRSMVLSKPKATFEEDLIRLSTANSSETEKVTKESYLRQEILFHPKKGRYLTASQDIAKGEKMLTEKAFAMVPVHNMKICRNCAAQNIIPFPCYICAKVFYCSLKCKKEQGMLHQYECYLYMSGMIPSIGIVHLALETFLKGFPTLIESLKSCTNETEIWEKIEKIAHSGDKGYAEVLALATNLKSRWTLEPETFYANCATVATIAHYIMDLTTFFELFNGSNCTKPRWTLVISAVILRHTFQMMCNATTAQTVSLAPEDDEFLPLCDVWGECRRIKKGQLHDFSFLQQTYTAIFPHLSVCNHSCEPSFRQKFDGDSVTVYARHQLNQGTELHNSYVPDCRNKPKTKRKENLEAIYHFDCQCNYCSADYNDDAYLQLFRYRCQNSSCRAVFVPKIDDQEWFLHDGKELSFVTCTKCKAKLDLSWYSYFNYMASDLNNTSRLIQMIKYTEKVLVRHSKLKAHLCENVAYMAIHSLEEGIQLSNSEFTAAGEAVKYILDVIEYRNDVRSVMYILKATYALDLMALGKYFNFDCNKIRISMDMLSTEMRTIFDNYINDYIGEKFYASGNNE